MSNFCPTTQKYCRICFEKAQDRSALITPCQCKGSSLYIHIHCLEIWQQISLQNNLPQKAEVCPICQTSFRYPSRLIRYYRRVIYSITNSWIFVTTFLSLLWISFVIVPLKVVLYTLLVIVTIPYGQLSLLGNTAVAWIGYEFPPQLALIYTYPVQLLMRNTWPLPTIPAGNVANHHHRVMRRSSSSLSLLSNYSSLQLSLFDLTPGVLLVASRTISPASMFYRAVILLLDYNPGVGSRGVIINFDTNSSSSPTTNNTSQHRSNLPTIPFMRHGIGGPMETEVLTVLHNYSDCARYSDKITIPTNNANYSSHANDSRSNYFYVADSQYANRTLSKISSVLNGGTPNWVPVRKQRSTWKERAGLSVREKARALLKPFPFFQQQKESRRLSSSEDLLEEENDDNDAITSKPSSSSANQPQHKFFKNPNYRKLSVEARRNLSPMRVQETLLSEVQAQLKQDNFTETASPFANNSEGNRTIPLTNSHSSENLNVSSWEEDEEDMESDGEDYTLDQTASKAFPKGTIGTGNASVERNNRILSIQGNCIWLANQLEGEIMHGFWHVMTCYQMEDIFPENEEDIRDLWNQMMSSFEEKETN